MAFVGLTNLCPPAFIYLVLSGIAMIVMALQNIGSGDVYCVGTYHCTVNSVTLVFIIKIIYILFWTWLLNIICKSGAEGISWFLVLFPFILFFIFIIVFIFDDFSFQGKSNCSWVPKMVRPYVRC